MNFQQQAVIATTFMVVIPMSMFFSARHYLSEYVYKYEEYNSSFQQKDNMIDMYSAMAAVIGVWIVIGKSNFMIMQFHARWGLR